MKKFLIALNIVIWTIAIVRINNAYAWDQRPNLPIQNCAVHSPYGFAATQKKAIGLCREGYLSAYDPTAKIPVYVAYTLQPQNALGCFPRTNAFVADQSVQGGPRPDDYAGTGYDKGHAAPDGDLSYNQMVEYESFLMTNMYPQHGSLNRGIWKLLETSVRGWSAQQNQTFTIYIGALYTGGEKRIGSGVLVPESYYKIVINQQTGQVAGWMFPHKAPYGNLGNDLTKFRAPINGIEQAAGVKFAFPANAREVQPGQEWPIDFGALTNAKRAKCGKAD